MSSLRKALDCFEDLSGKVVASGRLDEVDGRAVALEERRK
jgi:hypothetical protein